MKISAVQLRNIIKKETKRILREAEGPLWGCYKSSQYGAEKLVCSVRAATEAEARDRATELTGDRNFSDGYGECKEISSSAVDIATKAIQDQIDELQAQLAHYEK